MSGSCNDGSGGGAAGTRVRCSFCQKAPPEPGSLLEGPIFEGSTRASICRACVEQCAEIFENERAQRVSLHRGAMGPDSPAMQAALRRRAERARVDEVLASLDETEREVIKLVNGLSDGCSYTSDEIATKFDLPAARVAEIYDEAIAKLRSQGLQPVS